MTHPFAANILCVGLIRNGADIIEKEILNLSHSFSFAKKLHFFIVESDSNDQTILTLEELSNTVKNFEYVSLGNLSDLNLKRTERISICRNRYLDEIFSNKKYEDIDYVVMADLDGVNSCLNKNSVLSCWNRSDWDVCYANQKGAYYDIWALRHELWSPNDCWKQYDFLISQGVNREYSLLFSVVSRMILIPTDAPWISVNSAFGGLGLFKKKILKKLIFTGNNENGEEVCEWVEFNKSIAKRGGRIYINPSLINSNFNEHTLNYSNILNSIRLK